MIARFLPFVRTFAPIVAGAGRMHYPRFLLFNVAGGILWGAGVTTAGYFLGEMIPDVDRYLLPIIAVIILISALPTLAHLGLNYREEIWRGALALLGRKPTTPRTQEVVGKKPAPYNRREKGD